MSNLPKTFKAIVIEKPGAPWAIKDIPLEEPKAGQVLIKSEACGICHSDSVTQQGHMGAMAKFPLIPGHEVIGRIVAVGPDEKKWKVGDRVGG
jgi:D-arabinose 1-dehydrogenase-like Zn-dependent alcohol dehydrogenase